MIDPAADCWDALGEADSCGASLLSPILFPAIQGRVELVTSPSSRLVQDLPERYTVRPMGADTWDHGLSVA